MRLMQKTLRRAGLVFISVLAGVGIVPITVTAGPLPTWDNQINSKNRWELLAEFSGQAVLDKETGLVWEQEPDTATVVWTEPFLGAVELCYGKRVGGRSGWRLPTVEELNSLRDLEQSTIGSSTPALPPGHPFSNVSDIYWSITTDPSLPSRAYIVRFSGTFGGSIGVAAKGNKFRVWCVRGNHGYDAM